jgi:hypothetical protein
MKPGTVQCLMASSRDPKRRRREKWEGISVLLQLALLGVALNLPGAWRLGTLVIYAIVLVLAIVTFAIPAMVRARRAKKPAP